jgi:hypothetical protein
VEQVGHPETVLLENAAGTRPQQAQMGLAGDPG